MNVPYHQQCVIIDKKESVDSTKASQQIWQSNLEFYSLIMHVHIFIRVSKDIVCRMSVLSAANYNELAY